MNESQRKIYIGGETNALKEIIVSCQHKLGRLGVELKSSEQFSPERADIIKTLRSICEAHGDNDWTEDLHISDILNKHIDFNERVFAGRFKGHSVYVSADDPEAVKEFLEFTKTIG